MRAARIALWTGLLVATTGQAWPQAGAVPTPGTTGSDPGPTATERATSPTVPPAEVAPPMAPTAPVGPSGPAVAPIGPPGQVQYSPPPPADPPSAQAQGGLSPAEVRSLIESAQATAKATRESVDYVRVMPDLLTQILAKLDKLEDKLDRVESALKGSGPPARRR